VVLMAMVVEHMWCICGAPDGHGGEAYVVLLMVKMVHMWCC
jgi:hypothetical protein